LAGKWLITGAGGQLGSVLMRLLSQRGLETIGLTSFNGPQPDVGSCIRGDLTDAATLREIVRSHRPAIIVHAAAVTSIQVGYEQPDATQRVNVDATRTLVELSAEIGARIAFTSTDLVFDGSSAPYRETDAVSPLSVYARSKVEAEKIVLAYDRGVVVRPALMYGLPAVNRPTTFLQQIESLRTGRPLKLFEDEFRTPIWLEDAADATRMAAASNYHGTLHLGGPERLSRLEMGRVMAEALGISSPSIVPSRQSDMEFSEPRPADVSLDSSKFAAEFETPPGLPMKESMKSIAAAIA
jgi:dTDP-4-dehydrorhamnose reductase